MLLYSPTITDRIKYIAEFMGMQLAGSPIQLTTDKEHFNLAKDLKINYSSERISENEFYILPHSLLFENGIRNQELVCFTSDNQKAFFKTGGDWSFDIFASSFYLLSRYEEYLPHKKDEYGRYGHKNSLAFKEDFLDIPLINLWIQDFKSALKEKLTASSHGQQIHPVNTHQSAFSFIPTYDIDEAYSFKHKQWWRTKAGIIKDILTHNTSRSGMRKKVLDGKRSDPFDSYEWMDRLHSSYVMFPHYFFLVASKASRYDRNILPTESVMHELIAAHAKRYSIGVHPSWQSFGDMKLVKSEIATLESLSGQKIISSRQHFIRFEMPATYRLLIEAGILKDFSMGYGSINGFRASIASPFYWYDLGKEESTQLLVYPFCFMDANSFFEQKQSPEQALIEMKYYYKTVKSVNGMLSMIWHNTFLGTDPLFAGWREVYQQFIEEIQV